MDKKMDLSTPAKRQTALIKYCVALGATAEIMNDVVKLTKDKEIVLKVRKNSVMTIEEILLDISELLPLVKADLDK